MQERVIKHNGSWEKLPRNFYDIGKIRKVRKGISNTFGKCTVSLKRFKTEELTFNFRLSWKILVKNVCEMPFYWEVKRHLFSLVYAMRYVNQLGYSLSVHDHVRLER